MLMPAPIAVASPAKKATWGLCVCRATGEDRRQGGERAVDQTGHRRLDALEQEDLTVAHRLEFTRRCASHSYA